MDTEINKIRKNIRDLKKKLDTLLDERDTEQTMKLSEDTITLLYHDKPDLYSVNDLKVKYR